MFKLLLSAWRYRHFILSSIRAEFVNRFVRSKLGGLWVIIHPLTQVLIYALVLSALLSARLPGIDNRFAYAIYLCAGTLGWGLFSEIINRSITIFIDNAGLIKKIAFPRIALPLIMLGSALVNHFLLLLAVLVVFALLGHFPGLILLWLPLLSLIAICLAMGIGIILGVLHVFVRDIGQAMIIILQVLYWFTPIVYPPSVLSEALRGWLQYNPVYPIIAGYQDVLVFQRAPALGGLGVVFVLSLVILAFALLLFRKAGPDLLDTV
jgi:lipopolysaccharide transport system permease protein